MTRTAEFWCPGKTNILQKTIPFTPCLFLLVGLAGSGLCGLAAAQAQVSVNPEGGRTAEAALCLDGFCIGQPITDDRFNNVEWLTPQQNLIKKQCNGVGCQPTIAFRGYETGLQTKLADTLS